MSRTLQMTVAKGINDRLALTNLIYLHPDDAAFLSTPERVTMLPQPNYLIVKDMVYSFQAMKEVVKGEISMNGSHRTGCAVALGEKVAVEPWLPKEKAIYLGSVKLEVDFLLKNRQVNDAFDVGKMQEALLKTFQFQVFGVDQKFAFAYNDVNLMVRVAVVSLVELEKLVGGATTPGGPAATGPKPKGILVKQSAVTFVKAPSSTIKLTGESSGGPAPSSVTFRPDWNFESMGIGGLDSEFSDIFRRAFASRVFPPSVVAKLGIHHVKGILLYGPPGTGKTLMARQIGKMLTGREPKVVNGPEVLNKFVGQSEENIRNLFKDAEQEYAAKGDDSDLHILIFDELDAICRQRGTRADGTGVGDTVVNQLLSKIDGVNALNNILIIGMTNRKDMIDEALLRPGRLEVHMEISLPDAKGRLQIIKIHTNKMATSGLLDQSVPLEWLAQQTKNFSGAEIEGLVKSAASFALNRQINPKDLTKPVDPSKIKVTKGDFEAALAEVKPAFGASKDEFENCRRGGVIAYGPTWDHLVRTAQLFIAQLQNSERTSLMSILLEGKPGCGKTALAASLALAGDMPFVKLISPDDLVGWAESAKCGKIHKVFEDAYKSPMSVVVVDDIERLLEYVPFGNRFSNLTLQTLLVLFKKSPPSGHKLFIIGTTSNARVLEEMDLSACFNGVLSVPPIAPGPPLAAVLASDSAFTQRDVAEIVPQYRAHVPIKKLLNIIEYAKQSRAAQQGAPMSVLFLQGSRDYGIAPEGDGT